MRHFRNRQPAYAQVDDGTGLAVAVLSSRVAGPARWFVERVGTGHGRIRKITAIAVARKLLLALRRYLTTGLIPEGARVKVV